MTNQKSTRVTVSSTTNQKSTRVTVSSITNQKSTRVTVSSTTNQKSTRVTVPDITLAPNGLSRVMFRKPNFWATPSNIAYGFDLALEYDHTESIRL